MTDWLRLLDNGIKRYRELTGKPSNVYLHPETWQDLADECESRGNRPVVVNIDGYNYSKLVIATSDGSIDVWADKLMAPDPGFAYFWTVPVIAPAPEPEYDQCVDCECRSADVECRYDDPPRCEACHKLALRKRWEERAGCSS